MPPPSPNAPVPQRFDPRNAKPTANPRRVVGGMRLSPQKPGEASWVTHRWMRLVESVAPGDQLSCREALGLKPALLTLLVTGASQGATSLNELIPQLAATKPGLFAGWQVLHLCGQGDPATLERAYLELGIPCVVQRFQHRMGLAWGAADLAVSRAGANSVAEAAVNAVPTVFAPYPYHSDLHQKHNAQPLVDEGAAAMELDLIDPLLNVDGLGRVVRELMTDPARRTAMRERLRSRPREDAAMTIAKLLLEA